MRIIILGAGRVGGTLAEHLAGEANDITVVDNDERVLQALQDKLNVRVVVGSASLPGVLRQAGADDADMLIAVTSSDEINMIACQVAMTFFQVPRKIARVREADYLSAEQSLFTEKGVPVDVLISPENLVTERLEHLLEYPGALQVLDFADGRLQLVAVRASFGGALTGRQIAELRQHIADYDMRIAAVFRQEQAIAPSGTTVLEAGDEVFFVAAKKHIRQILNKLTPETEHYHRIMIAGGGHIGERLAEHIQGNYRVKLIEFSEQRCKALSVRLKRTTVLHGSATDKELLVSEGIEKTDVFLALTNDDETNIMASMLAKKSGARMAITLINNPVYVDLIQGGTIDIALSPQQSTIGALLTHVRRGDVAAVHSLRRGAAEALEAVAHGSRETSHVVGRAIGELNLPAGAVVGALVRGADVLIAHDDLVIEDGDHVIVFVADRRALKQVEQLFQVALNFF
ncbi:Trk system potassium transporter TrkA [Pseudohongiella spirulinae]|uniref:Trk system potassium uptake protein TrkA n=1 Tax=Pseudohongiella spirulinae TaxID=1249552 RepID=A0A0S2KEX9_9GAMM|nr:Trk system potassium transporter TrkA [Pseudohongiella spirulinae]ALO46865.1 potassium transporter peripheral membrane protein [Pseudohongiella spirulinae]